jgi:CDP-diacylglycerol---serine O-phosphatidyltransferase
MNMKANQAKPRHRGIYLLPNLFTTGAMFAGFYAITSAINHHFESAAIAMFIAMVCDGLDGRVARMTNTQSEFGVQYDSLSDMVSFGAAPAIVMYLWVLSDMGQLGLFAAFVHMAGGALRLARFNTQVEVADKRYFQGLPSPAAAAILAGGLWFCLANGIEPQSIEYLIAVFTISTGLLMVSNFRYSSFKELDLKGKVPFVAIIVVMLVIGFIMASPQQMLFVVSVLYALSGPVITLIGRKRRWQNRQKSAE